MDQQKYKPSMNVKLEEGLNNFIKFKKRNKIDKWDIDEVESTFWYLPLCGHCISGGMKKHFGVSYSQHLSYLDSKRILHWCILKEDLVSVGSEVVEKFKDINFRKSIADKMYQNLADLDEKIKECKRKNLSLLSLETLYEYFDSFVSFFNEGISLGIFFEAFDFVLPSLLKEKFPELTQEEINTLTIITVPTFLNVEEQNLLESNDLEQHREDYEWIYTGHAGKRELSVQDFENRLKEVKDVTKRLAYLKELEQELLTNKQEIMQHHAFNKEQLDLLQLIDDVNPLHDIRKEAFCKTLFYSEVFLERIALLLKMNFEDLRFYSCNEIESLLKRNRLSEEELQNRKTAVIYRYHEDGREEIISGKRAITIARKELTLEHEKVHKLEGVTASIGKASGKVKIVYGPSDFVKFNNGDILVTGMTRPDYVPIMKKAAAIITDEGGVTCHAAIVSRELKIPCIIATKIATKVLKDGDVVEVDADNGVVRKLE